MTRIALTLVYQQEQVENFSHVFAIVMIIGRTLHQSIQSHRYKLEKKI